MYTCTVHLLYSHNTVLQCLSYFFNFNEILMNNLSDTYIYLI